MRRELEALHAEMRAQPVEELALSGEDGQWIGVKTLREVERPDRPTQKLPVQPEGTAEINVPAELDKLVPADARAIDRDPATAPPPVRIFVSYAHDDERQLKRLDDDMDIFLFIASQSSMVRPYIKDPELRRAKERRAVGEIEMVAVKPEPCACDDDPVLGKLHRLAPRIKSIAEASLKSAAWEQVRRDLLPVITRVREKKEGRRGPRAASKGRAVGTSLRRGRSSTGPR